MLGSQALNEYQLAATTRTVEQLLNNKFLTTASSDVEDLEAFAASRSFLGRTFLDLADAVFNSGATAKKKLFGGHKRIVMMIWDKWMKCLQQLIR